MTFEEWLVKEGYVYLLEAENSNVKEYMEHAWHSGRLEYDNQLIGVGILQLPEKKSA